MGAGSLKGAGGDYKCPKCVRTELEKETSPKTDSEIDTENENEESELESNKGSIPSRVEKLEEVGKYV